jgi:hypothetical protein
METEAELRRLLDEIQALRPDILALGDAGRFGSSPVIALLLRWLDSHEDEGVQFAIVAALRKARLPFDGASLGRLFERTPDRFVRMYVARLMAEGRATGLDGWLARTIANPDLPPDVRKWLVLAAIRLAPTLAPRRPGDVRSGLEPTIE